jgi:hypothetical protein
VDSDLAEHAVAGGLEAVRSAGMHDDELAGPHQALLVSGREERLAVLHDVDLDVVVPVERGALAGRGLREDQRDADPAVVVPLELALERPGG